MPTKTFDHKITFRSKNTIDNPSGSDTVVNTQITFFPTVTISTGANLPNYRQLIAEGLNATTGMNVNALSTDPSFSGASASWKTSPNSGITFSNIERYINVLVSYPVAGSSSSADAQAIRALYAKIREVHQQFAGGVFLGELKQTLRMFARPAIGFLQFTNKHTSKTKGLIASAQKKGASKKNVGQIVASEYLNWTFGVKPFMHDIKDASKALARIMGEPPRKRFSVKGSSGTGPTRTAWGNDNTLYGISFRRYQEDFSEAEVKYYGMFEEVKDDPTLLGRIARVGKLSGFSLDQFVPTVWELIPYSFIVDYFVNIGDVLGAASTDTSSVKWVSKTAVVVASRVMYYEADFALSKSFNPTFLYQSFSGGSGKVVQQRKTIIRSAVGVPILAPKLNIDVFSGKQFANLFALVLAGRGK